MRLDPKMAEALNAHVSIEARTAFRYISMASWADVRGFEGFAAHFRREAEGELNHMRQFIRYLNDMDYQARISEIPAPRHEWPDLKAVVESGFEQEAELTAAINGLVALARETQDYFSESFLVGFIPNQIQDTATAETLRQRVAIAGDGQGLLLIDQELRQDSGH